MSEETLAPPVGVSQTAARRILAILAEEPAGSVFRVGVDGGGCSGFQYSFAVAEGPRAEDLIVERDGATVVIDQTSLAYLSGSTIDFVDDLMGQSFRIDNPNASASCGCGSSFSI